MKLQIIVITLLATSILAGKPWKNKSRNNKPWKRNHARALAAGKNGPHNFSAEVKQALDACILDTCSANYLTPACVTCKSECFELFNHPKQRRKCIHFGKCFEICEKPDEKKAFKSCKIRCNQAANTVGSDAEKIAAIKAVEAEGDTELLSARQEALKDVAANKKLVKQQRQAKKQEFHTCVKDGCQELLPEACTECKEKLHEKCDDATFREANNFKNPIQCRRKINKRGKHELSCKKTCWGGEQGERNEFMECKKNCKKSVWGKDSDLVDDEGEMRAVKSLA